MERRAAIGIPVCPGGDCISHILFVITRGCDYLQGRSRFGTSCALAIRTGGGGGGSVQVKVRPGASERRRWQRLPLAIPVFACGTDEHGKEFREFTTALNISAGGALLAMRRYLPTSSRISLEIPSAPLPRVGISSDFVRNLQAQLVTITHSQQCYLCGLKFARPLIDLKTSRPGRKECSSV